MLTFLYTLLCDTLVSAHIADMKQQLDSMISGNRQQAPNILKKDHTAINFSTFTKENKNAYNTNTKKNT